jgi:Papain family cysteine protease
MKRAVTLLVCTLFLVPGMLYAQEYGRGHEQSSLDILDLEPAWDPIGYAFDGAYYDWRDVGGNNYMSPVQNQNPCGTCWTFSALHQLESRIKIDEGLGFTDNFSEDAMADCTLPGGCAWGGTGWKAGAYLSSEGPALESCQPFTSGTDSCLGCPQQDYRLRKMITIANDVTAIKNALANGPVSTSMDSTGGTTPAFGGYTSGVLANGSPDVTDHGVLIIGWHEGTADPGYPAGDYWVCKNSWGTSWGMSGYFFIEYGAALIGTASYQFVEWEDSLTSLDKYMLFENENGSGAYFGTTPSSTYLFACQRLIPSQTGHITEVQWVNLGNNFNWQVRIYSSMSGGVPSGLLGGPYSGNNEPYGGITYCDIPSPVSINSGNDIYVCVQLHSPGLANTFPVEGSDSTYSGQAYVSTSNITGPYQSMSDFGMLRDWDIRVVVDRSFAADTPTPAGPTETPTVGVPTTGTAGIGILLVVLSGLIIIAIGRRN